MKQTLYSVIVPDYLLDRLLDDFAVDLDLLKQLARPEGLFTSVQAKKEFLEEIITPLEFKKRR